MNKHTAYQLAQKAVSDLKTAIYILLFEPNSDGLTNAEIGRSLGIYQGHIPRTLLSLMELEGVVEQNTEIKKWKLK